MPTAIKPTTAMFWAMLNRLRGEKRNSVWLAITMTRSARAMINERFSAPMNLAARASRFS
ncbi:hypothetical protein D3C73_1472870 [compost metagenome]